MEWVEFRNCNGVWRYVDYNRRLATHAFMSRQGLRKALKTIKVNELEMQKRFQDMGDTLLPENNRAKNKE